MLSNRIGLSLALVMAAMVAATTAQSKAVDCSFPKGDRTTTAELVAKVRSEKASCALPWRALKRSASDPSDRAAVDKAYDEVARLHPDRSTAVRARKADVAAASGDPREMLAIADSNVVASPDDKSLSNTSCYFRGRYGFDIEHAMPYCNTAVEAGRQGWALVNRGRVHLALGRFAEALADFNEALGKNDFRDHPDVVDAAYGRGIARIRLGDSGGARDIKVAMAARSTVAADFEDAGIRP